MVTRVGKIYNTIKRIRTADILSEITIRRNTVRNEPVSTTSSRRLDVSGNLGHITRDDPWNPQPNTSKGELRFHQVNTGQKYETKGEEKYGRMSSKAHPAYGMHKMAHVLPEHALESVPKLPYVELPSDDEPILDHIARQKFIREKLSSMVSEERMVLGVGYPSGHSGIDPVIAEYNQQKTISEFWDRVNAEKAKERCILEERKR